MQPKRTNGFISGIMRGISPGLSGYRAYHSISRELTSQFSHEVDAMNLEEDWQKVGADLWSAVHKYRDENDFPSLEPIEDSWTNE